MQENKFETEVYDELRRFDLEPSIAVWENVREAIQKKRKKRPVIWIWMSIFFCGSIGLYLVFNGKVNPDTQSTHRKLSGDNNVSVIQDKSRNKINNEDNVTTKIKEDFLKDNSGNRIIVNKTSEKDLFGKNEKYKNKSRVIVKRKTESPNNKKSSNRLFPDNTLNENVYDYPENTIKRTPIYPVEKIQTVPDYSCESLLEKSIFNQPIFQKRFDIPTTSLLSDKTVQNKNKWEFGVTIQSGFSNIVNNDFNFFKTEAADDQAKSLNAGPGGPLNTPTSDLKPAHSFAFGVQAERKINEQISLNIGLQYSQYNNSRRMGQRKDSIGIINNNLTSYSFDHIYLPGNTISYKTNYHFFQIPIGIQWKSNRGHNVSIMPHAGLNVGYLIKSDGLIYNNAGDFYYNDRPLLNKIQLNAAAGINFKIFNSSRYAIQLGPYIQSAITPLYKREYNNSHRVVFAGINTSLSFK